jgi:hypothetical protein
MKSGGFSQRIRQRELWARVRAREALEEALRGVPKPTEAQVSIYRSVQHWHGASTGFNGWKAG